MSAPQRPNYSQTGAYDRASFIAEYAKLFKHSGYASASIQNLLPLLGFSEGDKTITDLRWTAYMLATASFEAKVKQVSMHALVKKGKPMLDKKHHPVMVKQTQFLVTPDADEAGQGKGLRYHQPVKIKLLKDGNVQITEHDGDKFLVKRDGKATPLTKGAKMGASDKGAAAVGYEKDDGVEHAYFGRGFVQLTWWSNYALAGVALGKGLAFLINPELVKTPLNAYTIMAYGMVNGAIFSRHKFTEYFTATSTDYEGAREMVNPNDKQETFLAVAGLAKKFETALLNSRIPHKAPPQPVKAH